MEILIKVILIQFRISIHLTIAVFAGILVACSAKPCDYVQTLPVFKILMLIWTMTFVWSGACVIYFAVSKLFPSKRKVKS